METFQDEHSFSMRSKLSERNQMYDCTDQLLKSERQRLITITDNEATEQYFKETAP